VIARALADGNESAWVSVMSVNGAHMVRADDQEEDMTSFKIFAAALALTAFAAAPASAWQAIDEPGSYSFYHPNEDVLNVGPSPSTWSQNAAASTLRSSPATTTQMSVRPRRGNSAAVRRY
jgi:hypothetical protein